MFSSIVELKENKARVFLKRNIFHNVARYERMKSWAKFTQNAILLYCPFLFIEKLILPSFISFPINMEGSKRTATRIVHLSSSTKNKQKTKKIEPLFSKNTSNCFKFIMTLTSGKTCGLRCRIVTITLLLRTSRTGDNIFL